MYKLIIEDDEGKTTVVPLIRDEITIGRKEGNTIRLTERNVSRKHAKLVKQNGSVFIEDLTSYNGIRVNGDRIAGRAPVNEGDRIQIGDYQLALKLDKATAAGGPTTAPMAAAAPPAAAGTATPTAEMADQKTTPFSKENGAAPTQLLDMVPTTQTPIQSPAAKPAAERREDTPARLVVVSSNFAGQEYVLDKAAVVIGRTDENDIVINHRSISRHHAKVMRENGHFHIVDLQSANGVRVNGEEYGKVELRKADLVDLGHVRLRFVAPGEDFLFDRDAQVIDVSGGKRSNAGVFVVIALVLVAVGGGIYAFTKLTQKPGGTTEAPKSANDGDTVMRLLVEADKALKSEDWEGAIAKAGEALKLQPSEELARDKQRRAEAEIKNRNSYQNFVKEADAHDFDAAVAHFSEVAEDSVYRQQGAERYAGVKKAYVRQHLDSARKSKTANKCEDARQHVEAVLTVDDGNAEAQDILKSCGANAHVKDKAAATEHKTKTDKTAQATKVKDKAAPDAEPQQSSAAAEKLVQEAQEAYVHGQYATAIEQAKKAVKGDPVRAWSIIGSASCFLKDRGGAVQAWNRLPSTDRALLRYVCSRNGITVP